VGHRTHELRSDGRHVYWFFSWREYSTVKSEQKASLEKASAEGIRRESVYRRSLGWVSKERAPPKKKKSGWKQIWKSI
jgi:hypothetical protein